MVSGVSQARMVTWGLGFAAIVQDATVLDAGRGGGANVAQLFGRAPQGRVTGIDYSPVSMKKSRDFCGDRR